MRSGGRCARRPRGRIAAMRASGHGLPDTAQTFESMRADVEAAHDVPGGVLGFGALEVKGRESKASVRAPIAWFFRFDGEKICWARAYSDRAAALQEAGVPESSLGRAGLRAIPLTETVGSRRALAGLSGGLRRFGMAQNFIACDRDQALLLPPDRAGLAAGGSSRVVRVGRGRGDGSGRRSMRAYRADGHGRPAYDPAMMVALLLYAYCAGQRSSRGIERRVRGGRRVPGDRGEPGAGSRDDRAVSPAPRGRAGRPVRRGAGAVRGGGAGRRSG